MQINNVLRHGRFTLTSLIVAALLTTPVLADGPLRAAAQDDGAFPHLQFEPGDEAFVANADLREVRLPLLTVSNPSREAFVTVEVLARSTAAGQVRSHLVRLEPLGAVTLSFETGSALSSVSILSEAAFEAELSSGERGEERPLAVTSGPLAAAGGPGSYPPPLCLPKCLKQWTLTCNSGGCSGLGPFTEYGRVMCDVFGVHNQVYWKLNTPTGPWKTIGDQGITAEWTNVDQATTCPTRVKNSLGHVYDITFP